MKTNYHTHTHRCNHAVGSDEGYVQNAIFGGYDLLGFADHTPWPFTDGYVSPIRMRLDQVDGYVASIRRLAEVYKNQIEITVGLECEYYPDYIPWLKELKERLALDYLLLGNHYPYTEPNPLYFAKATTHEQLKIYLESSIKAMETRLFDCFAHPELFMRSYPTTDDYCKGVFGEIATAAKELGVTLELNTSMPTFHTQLWEIVAQVGCKVIIGMDAHDKKLLKSDALYSQAEENLRSVGITPIYKL